MTRARHWSDIEERSFVLGMRVLFGIYRLLGRRVMTVALYPVVAWYFLFNGTARRASLEYLGRFARRHPDLGIRADLATSFRHFLSFAEALVDKLAAWRGDVGYDAIDFPDRDRFLALLESGRGAMILTSHLGNAELSRALAELNPDIRLNVLVHTRHADKFNRFMEELSDFRQLHLMQIDSLDPVTAMQLAERIRRGEFIVVAADRTPPAQTGRTSRVRFLGEPASFPQGPFIIAALLGCPVYTMACLRRSGRHEISFEPFSERLALPRRDRQSALTEYAARFAAILERHCRRAPLQWFNFYPFWDEPPTQPRRA